MKRSLFSAIIFLQFIIPALICLIDYKFFSELNYNDYKSNFWLDYFIMTWPQLLILVLMGLGVISRRLTIISLLLLDFVILILLYLLSTTPPDPLNQIVWVVLYPWLVLLAFLISLTIKKIFYKSEIELI